MSAETTPVVCFRCGRDVGFLNDRWLGWRAVCDCFDKPGHAKFLANEAKKSIADRKQGRGK